MTNLSVTLTIIELFAIMLIAGFGCMLIGIGIGRTLKVRNENVESTSVHL